MFRFLVMIVGASLAVTAGWLLRGWFAGPAVATETRVLTSRVLRGRMEQQVKARGIVKPAPNALVRLGFATPKDLSRRIQHLTVVEGETVQSGVPLVELDHEDLKASRQLLAAELQVFERRLEALQQLEPVEVDIAEAVVAERKTQKDHAHRVKDRTARLTVVTAASLQESELAVHDLGVADAKFNQAEAALRQVRARFRTEIATLQAQIKQAKSALGVVEVQIGWCAVRSPFDVPAQVFAVHQRQGELTSGQPAAPVLTLLDLNQLQAHLYVDEADFGRIQLGQKVSLRAESYPDQVLSGKIVRVLPQPILQDNVVYYLAAVEIVAEQRQLLRPEMTVLAHIQAGVNDAALWLPLKAVQSRSDGWYVLRPGAAGGMETPVRIGWKDQGRVEIRQGLAEGDEVLLEP